MRSPCEKTTGTMCSSTDVSTVNDVGAFEHLCQAQTYINAFKHCRKESIWKASTQKFEEDLLVECCELAHAVRTHTYTPEPYLEFDICERGKHRHIKAPTIRDRVFMHALCQDILNPRIVPKLIYDNSAAIKAVVFRLLASVLLHICIVTIVSMALIMAMCYRLISALSSTL